MDYYKIGQRIRKFRKANNLSQEKLAEYADISVTHMSHIETGNTKLSLSVCVKIASALEVRVDDLISDSPLSAKPVLKDEVGILLDSCSEREAKTLVDLMKANKVALDKYMEQS